MGGRMQAKLEVVEDALYAEGLMCDCVYDGARKWRESQLEEKYVLGVIYNNLMKAHEPPSKTFRTSPEYRSVREHMMVEGVYQYVLWLFREMEEINNGNSQIELS